MVDGPSGKQTLPRWGFQPYRKDPDGNGHAVERPAIDTMANIIFGALRLLHGERRCHASITLER